MSSGRCRWSAARAETGANKLQRNCGLRFALPLCLFVAGSAACSENTPAGRGDAATGGDGPTGGDGGPSEVGVITTDVDGDGIDDDFERTHGLDPTTDDSAADLDGDGLSNLAEFQRGTLPNDVDSDDDGVPDGDEDTNHNGRADPGETDPVNPDSDGDGIPDGIEGGRVLPATSPLPGILGTGPGFVPDADNASTTDANNPDTDGDGILDGTEDANKNGRLDPGETDPLDVDSDDDGLADGTEDANHNGAADAGETSPSDADSDGDGLPDGVESGVTQPIADPDGRGRLRGTDPAQFRPDLDPTTTTIPTNPDSDGDGVLDGDEDINHNGRFDPPSELDPRVADTDMDGVPDLNEGTAVVCSERALRAITQHRLASADLNVGLPTTYSQVSVLREQTGTGVGFMFADPTSGVVGFAVSRRPMGGDVAAEKQRARNQIDGAANLSTEQDRALISWDGFPAIYTTAAAARANRSSEEVIADMAQALAEAGNLSGALPAGAGNPGNFTLIFETIFRSGQRAVIVGAIAPVPTANPVLIALSDVANGTGVAQFSDFTGVGCDNLLAPATNDNIDLMWVVDNSCSMSEEQAAVAAVSQEMVNLLGTTNLSWRLALTTTDQADGRIDARGLNGFTVSSPRAAAVAASQAWAAAMGALGTGGSGEERGLVVGLDAARRALPASIAEDPLRFREGATVIIVHLSDEEDFSVKEASGGADDNCPENAGKQARIDQLIQEYRALQTSPSVAGITTFAIHGISPGTQNFCTFNGGAADCNASQHGRAFVDVANAVGGGSGSICGNMSQVVQDIIRAGAGIASQLELSKPPISSTLRLVAADANGSFTGQPDVPRSRTNGFDYAFDVDVMSGQVRHKLVLYGSPVAPGRQLVASYRTWEHGSPDPDQPTCDCPSGQVCHVDTNICQIDPTCGAGCMPGMMCNPTIGVCVPDDPCGGTCGNDQRCDVDTARCVPDDPCNGQCSTTEFCDDSGANPVCRPRL